MKDLTNKRHLESLRKENVEGKISKHSADFIGFTTQGQLSILDSEATRRATTRLHLLGEFVSSRSSRRPERSERIRETATLLEADMHGRV